MKQRIKNTKVLLFILMIAFFPLMSQAQPQGQQGPPPVPNADQIKKMVDELAVELSLNDNQKVKISKLYVTHFDELKAKQEKSKGKMEAQRGKMDKHRAIFEKDVKALLTEEQQKKFDKLQKNRKPAREGQRPPR